MTIDPKEVIEVAAEKVVNAIDARALIKLRLFKRSDVARICRVSAPMVDSLGIPSLLTSPMMRVALFIGVVPSFGKCS